MDQIAIFIDQFVVVVSATTAVFVRMTVESCRKTVSSHRYKEGW